jgi:hypothetical protein
MALEPCNHHCLLLRRDLIRLEPANEFSAFDVVPSLRWLTAARPNREAATRP